MNFLPIVLSLLPTFVWVLVWLLIRPRERSCLILVVGMAIGASLAELVWLVESFVDDFAVTTGRLSRDFIEQVVSAACCEELLKFVAVSALAIPILLHSWGDFSEQLFRDEPIHRSTRDTIEFLAWIGSIAATFIASLVILAGAFRHLRHQ